MSKQPEQMSDGQRVGPLEGLQYSPSSGCLLLSSVACLGGIVASLALDNPVQATVVSFGMLVVGAVSLFIARLPLYRQGKFFELGPGALSKRSRKWYRLAYWLIGVGLLLLAFIWIMRLSKL